MSAFKRFKKHVVLMMVLSMLLGLFDNVVFLSAKEGIKTFQGAGYVIDVREQASWDDGYVAEVSVINKSERDIRNWELNFLCFDGLIVNNWNADIRTGKGNGNGIKYKLKCHNDNRTIKQGEKTIIGFQASGVSSIEDIKSIILKETPKKNNAKEDFSISYRITGQWDNNVTIEATLTNNTSENIEDWEAAFDYDAEIYNIWNAKISSVSNEEYIIKNADHNAVIRGGESVTFGFQARFDDCIITCPNNSSLKSVDYSDNEGEKPTKIPNMVTTTSGATM